MKAVIVDLDGTLAFKHPGRSFYDASTSHLDEINEHIIPYLKSDREKKYKIIFLTGREEKYRESTVKFINIVSEKYDINFGSYLLYMRKNGDRRKAPIFKEEVLTRDILTNYDIVAAYEDDDRNVAMFKGNNVNVRKVAHDGKL